MDLTSPQAEPPSREALRSAHRVLVKVGTSTVANEDGRLSLTRLGAITEQIGELIRAGKQVIFVSSGAVGMGKGLLRKQMRMNMSLNELHQEGSITGEGGTVEEWYDSIHEQKVLDRSTRYLNTSIMRSSRSVASFLGPITADKNGHGSSLKPSPSFCSLLEASKAAHSTTDRKKQYDLACAAAGQFELMNFYSSLFGQLEIAASQILVTQEDFQNEFRLRNLSYAVERLLSLDVVPIINENDAVSANTGYTTDDIFSDNDSLAAICARSFDVDVVLLLTDVEGVFDRPPMEKGARMLGFYRDDVNESVTVGGKSAQGRGGMGAKIEAAINAVKPGSMCTACVVASGRDLNSIRAILGPAHDATYGPPKGTLFATPRTDLWDQCIKDIGAYDEASVPAETRTMAINARNEARKIINLPYSERQAILHAVADALLSNKKIILQANTADLQAAKNADIAAPLVRRLKLTDHKLTTLALGIRQIAQQSDPLSVLKSKRELSPGIELSQITVPIGVLLVIFESRPDSLPQISALALASGNGLLIKGGKEASQSNEALYCVIGDAIESASQGKIRRDIIALVTSRAQVADMLNLDNVIDLVIPRGGNALVSYIKANTRIPVLGHADGVCHVYIAPTATAEATTKIAVDAKTDYPSACNAMETLLLHEDTLKNGVAMETLMSLRLAGVKCLGGPGAMKAGLCDVAAVKMKCEYGDLTCMVEVVENIDEAIDWIHKYGSGHTETIVCGEDDPSAEEFLKRVDAACVFKNTSTRFADGYRFGLGAEVGISTARIHARGPVGVEGLLSKKYQIRSKDINCVAEYAGDTPIKVYTHKDTM